MSKSGQRGKIVLILVGLASLVPYLHLLQFDNLREHILSFERSFFLAFLLYAVATLVVLYSKSTGERVLIFIFLIAACIQFVLLFTRPALSDDMYRYVWDGRVQAQGISPYEYSPSANELAYLKDAQVWPNINRKSAVTVYPPVAQVIFMVLWQINPDQVWWFQASTALGALLAGVLLVGLLRDLGITSARVLIFLWSPLLLIETTHSAHIDGIILPLLVGALWARVRERDGLVGLFLGAATGIKFYPLFLFPALWRPRDKNGRWIMPLVFVATLAIAYLPYILMSGVQVVGYLPQYLKEKFNISPLVAALVKVFEGMGVNSNQGIYLLTMGVLIVITLWMIQKPVSGGRQALRRCIWLIGAVTLLSQNLFPWYMLWLLPLIAIFLEPSPRSLIGRSFNLDAWSGWWLFCGLIALSYTFFIDWKTIQVVQWIQFLPLYAFLLIGYIRGVYPVFMKRWFKNGWRNPIES